MSSATRNILVRVPEQIANRLESVVPRRKRNQFIVDRLTKAIEDHDAALEKIAALVTADEQKNPELQALLTDWGSTSGDGIDDTVAPAK
jgi:hypothetical protein